MRFDASAATQKIVQKTVAIDPRTIRCGVVKLGSSLREVCDVKGTVPWRKSDEEKSMKSMLSGASSGN